MKALTVRLWVDDCGAVLSAEIMLIGSVLVIGVIAGLSSLRDSVVTELADLAQAVANVNQSYSYSGVSGHHTFSGGGVFEDQADFCDRRDSDSDRGNSKCVTICSNPATPEGHGGGHGGGHGHK